MRVEDYAFDVILFHGAFRFSLWKLFFFVERQCGGSGNVEGEDGQEQRQRCDSLARPKARPPQPGTKWHQGFSSGHWEC